MFRLTLAWTIALFVCFAGTSGEGKDVNILNLVWLTDEQGSLLQNFELISSNLLFPVAIKHFNERYAEIVPAVANYRGCDVQLKLVDGIMHDTRGQSSIAVSTFLSDISIQAILGGASSDVTRVLGITAGALNVPLVSHIVGDDALSNKGLYSSFFRVIVADLYYAEAIAKLFSTLGYKKIGIIHGTDTTTTSFRDSLNKACEKYDIALVAKIYRPEAKGSALNLSLKQALQGLASERLNIVVHTMVSTEYLWEMSVVAKELNYIEGKMHLMHLSFFGDVDLQGAPNLTALREFLHGSFQVARGYPLDNVLWQKLGEQWPTFDFNQDVAPSLPANYSKMIPEDFFQRPLPQSYFRYRSWTTAYDAAMALGMAACNGNQSSGPKWLQESLAKVRFVGSSGEIAFDAQQDRATNTADFALENLLIDANGNLERAEVAKMPKNGSWVILQPSTYGGGSLAVPKDVAPPPHSISTLPLGAKIFGWVEAFLVVLAGLYVVLKLLPLVICCGVSPRRSKPEAMASQAESWTSSQQTRPWQNDPQPEILMTLALCIVVMGFSIVASTSEGDGGCMTFWWLFSVSFIVALACLASRAIIFDILSRKPLDQRAMTAKLSRLGFLYVVGFLLLVCLLLGLWQGLDPAEVDLVTFTRDIYGNPLTSSSICSAHTETSWILFGLVCGMFAITLVVTVAVTLRVRNIEETYNEARLTVIASWCMCQVFFIGLPAVAATWNNALPHFLVVSNIVFLLCLVLLFTLFLPKLFKWRFSAINFLPPSRSSSDQQSTPQNGGGSEGRDQVPELPTEGSFSDMTGGIRSHEGSLVRSDREVITEIRQRRRFEVMQGGVTGSPATPSLPPPISILDTGARPPRQAPAWFGSPAPAQPVFRDASSMMMGIRPASMADSNMMIQGVRPVAQTEGSGFNWFSPPSNDDDAEHLNPILPILSSIAVETSANSAAVRENIVESAPSAIHPKASFEFVQADVSLT